MIADDERLWDLLDTGAVVERLGTGMRWAEGALYLPGEDAVLLSDIPNDRELRWTERTGLVVHRAPAAFANGRTLDTEGRTVTCSHGRRAVLRTEPDGTTSTLVDRFDGRKLNSPNDVVVKRDGTVWFTDPPYGIVSDEEGHAAESELHANLVFRLDPSTGVLDVVVADVEEPNGLAFSPDESLLYVADTSVAQGRGRNHHIRVYDVRGGRRACNGRVFAEISPGVSDGFRVDVRGNVFTSAADGVHVYAPDGSRLGLIPVPEKVANVCWGGPGKNLLYIAASTSLYRVATRTQGSGLFW